MPVILYTLFEIHNVSPEKVLSSTLYKSSNKPLLSSSVNVASRPQALQVNTEHFRSAQMRESLPRLMVSNQPQGTRSSSVESRRLSRVSVRILSRVHSSSRSSLVSV